MNRSVRVLVMLVAMGVGSLACDRPPTPASTTSTSEEPAPSFRNVSTATAYVGDTNCTSCHAAETAAYRQHAMSKSFHRWTEATRIEPTLETPLRHPRAGLSYTVIEVGHRLYQVEFLTGSDGRRIHELRRRIDQVMAAEQLPAATSRRRTGVSSSFHSPGIGITAGTSARATRSTTPASIASCRIAASPVTPTIPRPSRSSRGSPSSCVPALDANDATGPARFTSPNDGPVPRVTAAGWHNHASDDGS